MAEEVLAGILTCDFGIPPPKAHRNWSEWYEKKWNAETALAWKLDEEAHGLGYYLHLRSLFNPNEHEVDEFDLLSRVDQDLISLLLRRLPKAPDGQSRLYFVVLSHPLDSTTGEALAREIDSLKPSSIDDSKPGGRRSRDEVRAFRLLKCLLRREEVVDGIVAAFTWELSWPHLAEKTCSLEVMLDDLSHWFDRDGSWVDKTYHVTQQS